MVTLHGNSSARLLQIPSFQAALSEGRQDIAKFFVLNETDVNIPFNHNGIQYNPHQPEQYAAEILSSANSSHQVNVTSIYGYFFGS